MSPVKIQINPAVTSVFEGYPKAVQPKMQMLRDLILKCASEIDEINSIEETLKWGEPSYCTSIGSTLRIAWKSKRPDHYAMYFQCSSRLVPTFKMLFKDIFEFEGQRAIVFGIHDQVPTEELCDCIKAALQYHKVKQLPTLGI